MLKSVLLNIVTSLTADYAKLCALSFRREDRGVNAR